MRVSGTHRPVTAHDEPTAAPVSISAEGVDFHAARQALHDQVPPGHRLLHIVVEG